MIKITNVRTTVVGIPRIERLTTSYGSTDLAITVVVEVMTDAGITGIGQTATGRSFWAVILP